VPDTHGSTSESSDPAASFDWTPPTLHDLASAELDDESVPSLAVNRAVAERTIPRPIRAVFDNKMTVDREGLQIRRKAAS
jgi:hypothetical protein